MTRRTTYAALLIAVVITLASCSATGLGDEPVEDADPGSSARVNIDLPDKNRARWVMPLDEYFVSDLDMKQEAYLHALYSQACLTEQGFHHVVPAMSLESQASAAVRVWFDETVARKFGYHSPASSTSNDDRWIEYTQRPMSETELEALDMCVRQVVSDPEVPKWSSRQLNFASTIAAAAITGAIADVKVSAATDAWRACMKPLGIEDLPEGPDEMPTSSMRLRYGWAGNAVDTGPPLTSDEIRDAVADAKCQVSSGYSQAVYDAEWDRQVSLLEKNYEPFVALGKEIVQERKDISEHIALMSPAR